MLIRITIIITSTILSASLAWSSGLMFSYPTRTLCLSFFLVAYVINAVLYRTASSIINARNEGSLSDKFLYDAYRFSFSIFYIFLVIFLPGRVSLYAENSLLIKGGFTVPAFYEVLLLVVLLLLAVVSYFRCWTETITGESDFINATVKAAMHLFSTYLLVLIYPFVCWNNFILCIEAFLSPLDYFNKFQLVDIFLVSKGSVYILVSKIALVILGNFYLHLIKKYYSNYFISHNFFVVAIVLIWSNILLIGVDSMLITFAFFDLISMATVAFIVQHEKPNEHTHSSAALYYYAYSIFTSIAVYFGLYFLYSQYHTFSFCSFFLMFESGALTLPNGFIVLAWFLISIKLVFLIGAVPFYKYMVDVGSIIYYPSIYYWSVVSKLAVVVVFVKVMCIVDFIAKDFFSSFWKIILVASILYGSIMLCSTPRLKVFFAFSSLVNISSTILFATINWKASVFVVLISFMIYSFAMFGLLLFLSCPRRLAPYSSTRGIYEVDVFENLYWSVQEIAFSKDINSVTYEKDIFSFFVKAGTGICVLVLMGAAPFAGFLMKFLQVSAFFAVSSVLVCASLLISAVFAHLGYFALFSAMSEKVLAYTKHSYNEWILQVNEDDLMYFQIVFIFNIYATIFCLSLIF